MAMKTILVPIPDTAVDPAAIEIALMVAKAVTGHIEGLYIDTPASITLRTGRLGGYEAVRDVGLSPAAQRAQEEFARAAEAREHAAERALAEFQRICAKHGVPVCAPDASDPVPSASWRQTEGLYASAVTIRAPAYDVMVVPNPSTTTPAREIAEHTLLETGRPVLLSPARPEPDPSSSAMIAWSPSLQAWRAVAAAVPLMATARQVEIVSVGEDETGVAESRADVIRYLGWHGITATARQVKPLSRNIGDTLLHEASESGTGMLVMGAYSHSRVRELLLGGVTRHVLSNVAVTPVFMAH
jgi:nucleotide-binding universal stress UspA family protein